MTPVGTKEFPYVQLFLQRLLLMWVEELLPRVYWPWDDFGVHNYTFPRWMESFVLLWVTPVAWSPIPAITTYWIRLKLSSWNTIQALFPMVIY
jgi:hypothetical protein